MESTEYRDSLDYLYGLERHGIVFGLSNIRNILKALGNPHEKLKVIPWINFLAGMRFKPHRNVHIYVDGGFGIGFQVGTRVGYIF